MLDSRGSGTSPNAIITTFGAVCTSAPSAGTALCGSACAPAVTASPATAAQARVAATTKTRRLLNTWVLRRLQPIARFSALSSTATMIATTASVVAPEALDWAPSALVAADCAVASALAARRLTASTLVETAAAGGTATGNSNELASAIESNVVGPEVNFWSTGVPLMVPKMWNV